MAQALTVASQQAGSIKDPTASLTAAILNFESVLTDEQGRNYRDVCVKPDASDVTAFLTRIDNDNQAQAYKCVALRLSTFLDATRQFTRVVDTFVNADPVIADRVWGSIEFTIAAASHMVTHSDNIASMLMTTGSPCPIYSKCEQLVAGSVHLQHAFCEYYAAVVRLCTKVVETLPQTSPRQLLPTNWTFSQVDLGPHCDEINQAAALVNTYIRLASKKANNEATRLSELERQESRKQRSLLSKFNTDAETESQYPHQWRLRRHEQWMTKLRASIRDNLSDIDHLKAWRHVYQQRAPATAQWLHHNPSFLKWRKDEMTAVMWCPGALGMGKTVLAANIVAHLQQTCTGTDVVCYHFCHAQNQISLSARMILGTLARQMISTVIEHGFDYDLLQLNQTTEDLEAGDIVDFLLPLLQRGQHYYVVIDGLDETEREDIQILAQSIATLCKKRRNGLKILCTGRPELEQHLFSLRKVDYRIAVTKERLVDDIEHYSTVTLGYLIRDGSWASRDPILIPEISKTLKGVSDGVFLWARLFIEEMCARKSDHDISNTLRALPSAISELIDTKMIHIKGQHGADQALKLLRCCGVLRRPLRPDEYQELLSISIGQQSLDRKKSSANVMEVVAACHGLVSVDLEHGTVDYAHPSIRQHLFTNKGLHRGEFEESDSDTYVGELCLTYLHTNHYIQQSTEHAENANTTTRIRSEQMSLLPTTQNNSIASWAAHKLLWHHDVQESMSDSASSSREREHQSGDLHFLEYALIYWLDHLKHLDIDRDARSWTLFCNLITDRSSIAYKPWLAADVSSDEDEIPHIVHWSTRNEHHALLLYVLSTSLETLTEEVKQEILCCTTTSSLSSRLVSIVIQRGRCRETTLIRGFVHAARHGLKDCVDQYLTATVPLDSRCTEDGGMTALQAAAGRGHIDVVKILLAAGADVNAPAGEYDGRTALQAATDEGYVDIVERLLAAGAKVNEDSRYSEWATLQKAIQGGHFKVVNRLIAASVTFSVPYRSARTVPQNISQVQWKSQEDLSIDGSAGKDMVRSDQEIQQDVSGHDKFQTPKGNPERSDQKENLDLNVVDDQGRTSLIWASEEGHAQMVEILLRCGADVNAQGGRYGNALQSASARGHMMITELLLDHGANMTAEGGLYNSAIDAAIAEGHQQIVQMLLQRGASREPQSGGIRGVSRDILDDQLTDADDSLMSEWQTTPYALTNAEEYAHAQMLREHPVSSNASLRSPSVILDLSCDENAETQPRKTEEVTPETVQDTCQPQHKRRQLVTWTCSCGEQLSDYYTEFVPGAVETLQRCLRQEHVYLVPSWYQPWIETIRRAFSVTYVATESHGGSGHNESHPHTNAVTLAQSVTEHSNQLSRGSGQDTSTEALFHPVSAEDPNLRCLSPSIPANSYLLLCLPEKFAGLKLYHQQIKTSMDQHISACSISSDKQLFKLLNQRYYSIRKTGLSRIWPRTVVRVSMANFLVDLEKYVELRHYGCQAARPDCQCIPPTTNLEYHYNPRDPPYRPPIATNYLTHYFQNPDCIRSDSFCFTLNQIPKRLSECIVTSNDTRISAWGLEFEEGWHQGRLQKTFAWLIIVGAVVFFALWWGLEKDVQGASGVASFCVGTLALLGYLASSDPRMSS